MSQKLIRGFEEDEFRINGSDFIHIFRYMLENGSIAKMSGNSLKVYIVIKTLSGFENGKTTASIEDISISAGLSRSSVLRAIKELKEQKYLFSERFGRKNTYQIIETIPTVHKTGNPQAIAEIPYSRKSINKLVKNIKQEFINKLSGNDSFTGIRDINIILNTGNINNLIIGDNQKEVEEEINVEFSLVEMFNKEIEKKV